jgi:hypothetical protein
VGTPHDSREPEPAEPIQSFYGLGGTSRRFVRSTSKADRRGQCIEATARKLANAMAAQQDIEKGDVRLAPQIQSNIGQELRVVYMDVIDQHVPEHLQKLLERLDDHDDVTAKG